MGEPDKNDSVGSEREREETPNPPPPADDTESIPGVAPPWAAQFMRTMQSNVTSNVMQMLQSNVPSMVAEAVGQQTKKTPSTNTRPSRSGTPEPVNLTPQDMRQTIFTVQDPRQINDVKLDKMRNALSKTFGPKIALVFDSEWHGHAHTTPILRHLLDLAYDLWLFCKSRPNTPIAQLFTAVFTSGQADPLIPTNLVPLDSEETYMTLLDREAKAHQARTRDATFFAGQSLLYHIVTALLARVHARMKATLVCLIGSAAGVLACPSSRQLYTQGNGKPSAKNRGDTHTYQLHAYQYLLFLRACIRSWLPAVGTHLAQTQYAFSNLAGGSHYWTVVATLVHGTPEVKTLIPANYSIVAETTIKHTLTTPIWYNAQTVYECFDLIQTHNDSAPRFKDKTAHASNATPTPGVGKRQRDPDPRWIGKQTRPDSHASTYGNPTQAHPDSRGHAYGNPTQPPSTTQCFMVDGRSFRMVPTSPDRTLTTPYGPPKDAPSRHRNQRNDRHDRTRAPPPDQRRRDETPLHERNNRDRSARGRKRRNILLRKLE